MKYPAIVVAPSAYQVTFFENKKELQMITFYTIEEIIEKLTYTYSQDAIIYLMENQNLTYDNAKIYLENMRFIEDKCYNDSHIKELLALKNELISLKLLDTNPLFRIFLERHNVYVYGYELNLWQNKILNEIKSITTLEINDITIVPKEYNCVECMSKNEEIDYLFYQIYHLLDKGVDINKIHLINIDQSYWYLLEKYSHLYHIPLADFKKIPLLSNDIVKHFLKLCESYENKDIINILLKEYPNHKDIIEIIINFCNSFSNLGVYRNLVYKNEIKNLKYPNVKYSDVVKIGTIDAQYSDDDYVFIIGFNKGALPKEEKNERFFSDKQSTVLRIDTTMDLNEVNYNTVIKKISSINNLFLSYALSDITSQLEPSLLVAELNMNIIKPDFMVGFSALRDRIILNEMLDEYYKYHHIAPKLPELYVTHNPKYKIYKNEYSKIKNPLHYMTSGLRLSYTQVNDYFKCPFSYYLKNILKISKIEDMYFAKIGSIVHELCEKYTQFNEFEHLLDTYLLQFETSKQKFFFKKIWFQLPDLFAFLNEIKNNTLLNDYLNEEQFTYEDNDLNFIGFIDKIIYHKAEDKTYIAIFDFKTGSFDPSLKNLDRGLNLQLPVYAYLISKSQKFVNPQIIGIYFIDIVPDLIKFEKNKSYENQLAKRYQLNGYSLADREKLSYLDSNFEHNKLIKKMQLKIDGSFSHYAKVYTEEELTQMQEIVHTKIHEAFDLIINGEFPIRPIKIKGKDQSCTYCIYENICNKKYEDYCEYEDDSILFSKEGGDTDESDT